MTDCYSRKKDRQRKKQLDTLSGLDKEIQRLAQELEENNTEIEGAKATIQHVLQQ